MKPLTSHFPAHAPPTGPDYKLLSPRVHTQQYNDLFLAFPFRGGISTIVSILFSKFYDELYKRNNFQPLQNGNLTVVQIAECLAALRFKQQDPSERRPLPCVDRQRSLRDVRRRTPRTLEPPTNPPTEPGSASCCEDPNREGSLGED